jgi:hypothetical protein
LPTTTVATPIKLNNSKKPTLNKQMNNSQHFFHNQKLLKMRVLKFIIAFGLTFAFSNSAFSQKELPAVIIKYHRDGGGGSGGGNGGSGGGSGYEPTEAKEPRTRETTEKTVEREHDADLKCTLRPIPICVWEYEGTEKKTTKKVKEEY